MIKKTISIVVAVSMILVLCIPSFALDNNLQDEAVTIQDKIQQSEGISTDNWADVSIEEIEDTLESFDEISDVSCEEDEVSIDEALGDAFDREYVPRNATDIISRTVDGKTYRIEAYVVDNNSFVRIYSADGMSLSTISIVDDRVTVDSFNYNEEENCYDKRNIEFVSQDVADDIDTFTAQVKYGSKTYSAEWKDKEFWYAVGSQGSKTYLKIGQKATYQIRTDTLSDTKDEKCESYKTSVKKSKSYYLKGCADIAGTSFSVGFIMGLILMNAAFPPSVIVDAVLAALGGGSIVLLVSGVKNLVNSFEKWQDAYDYYIVIRTYGKKL